jgi:hypothetical protein
MTRFENQFPDLAAKLKQASVEKQRAVCLAACEYAVARAKIEDPLVMEALGKLRAREVVTIKHKRELEALVEKLDSEYFELAGAFNEGRASLDDYQEPFSKARAVASVLYAFHNNAYNAASEAIYEAEAVTDEDALDMLVPIIEAILK